jgi:hypothetical protein
MNQHWSEIFGERMTAAEIVRSAINSGITVPDYLHATYLVWHASVDQQDDQLDFDKLGEQVVDEALTSMAEHIYNVTYDVDSKSFHTEKVSEIKDWLTEGEGVFERGIESLIVEWMSYDDE